MPSNTATPELVACPFGCSEKNLSRERNYVVCDECEATGPVVPSAHSLAASEAMRRAALLWNTRSRLGLRILLDSFKNPPVTSTSTSTVTVTVTAAPEPAKPQPAPAPPAVNFRLQWVRCLVGDADFVAGGDYYCLRQLVQEGELKVQLLDGEDRPLIRPHANFELAP